jgi:hypothetical protein
VAEVHSPKISRKEIAVMNSIHNAVAEWDFSTWFVVLSPVIGIVLGLFAAFLVLR